MFCERAAHQRTGRKKGARIGIGIIMDACLACVSREKSKGWKKESETKYTVGSCLIIMSSVMTYYFNDLQNEDLLLTLADHSMSLSPQSRDLTC